MIQILGPLGMYFDAVVVEVEKCLLFSSLALAILCIVGKNDQKNFMTARWALLEILN